MVRFALVLTAMGLHFHGARGTKAHYCPADHCLQQKDTDSFSCEQFIDEGYQCDVEGSGSVCSCVGKVKYGNWEKWGAEKSFTGDTPCTNAVFTDVVQGIKFCWCTPTTLGSTVRSTQPAKFLEDGASIPAGYSKPLCIVTQVTATVDSPLAAALLPGKVFTGAAHIVVPNTMDKAFAVTGTKIVDYYLANQTALVQIPSDNLAKLQELRADSAPLSPILLDALKALGNAQLEMLGGLVKWDIPTLPSEVTTTARPATTTDTNTASSAVSFKGSGACMTAVGIVFRMFMDFRGY